MSDAASGRVLIISGPPGVGKTTVSRSIADTATRPTVHLHTDTFYVAIRTGYVAPYLPAAARQNETIIGVIVGAAWGYARGGYDVILDGIIGPWFLPPFRTALAHEPLDLSFVVLRPSLEIAVARATAREGRELKELAPIEGLYRAFESLGPLESHVIDSGRLTTAETVARVRDGWLSGRLRLA